MSRIDDSFDYVGFFHVAKLNATALIRDTDESVRQAVLCATEQLLAGKIGTSVINSLGGTRYKEAENNQHSR